MRQYYFEILLTNGEVENTYYKWAFNEKEAIILAQAEAIQNARGYELISIAKCKMSRLV